MEPETVPGTPLEEPEGGDGEGVRDPPHETPEAASPEASAEGGGHETNPVSIPPETDTPAQEEELNVVPVARTLRARGPKDYLRLHKYGTTGK